MFQKRFYYRIQLQYLGFRYHGWQKQPTVNTVERMVGRTLAYILERKNFKLLAAGRTDAKVSANETYVELFLDDTPLELEGFLSIFNKNLPPDIRALSVIEVDKDYNIMNAPKKKEYLYLFAYGEKSHPFAAPFMCTYLTDLNLPIMQEAAQLFEGTHDFKNYTYRPTSETKTVGTIITAEIIENTLYTANFFPNTSYIFRVIGKGFKRHQIRLMMGALFDLGAGKIDLDFIQKTLDPTQSIKLEHVAQASGLILNEVTL
ncbi:MAG: tRNA pseudouridine(38-40) synthase TruA [Bacteroidetes bacterium]|nr:tRNA pseudouridine(38-40) synthase TruA [Bacteroidota bacterium]